MFGPQRPRQHPQRPYTQQPHLYSHPQMGANRPQQPPHWGMPGQQHPPFMQQGQQMMQYQQMAPQKPSLFKSAFMSEDGKFDMGKTVNTVDQVVKTVHQVSPLVKQVGSFFIKK
ncbi:YppG family protein [Halalkalibacter urbisdiaboli]|uniref:YppG family protein n=1 Tax=Halalkalibacter urbisdiaboli TaxID=1960589 RepID=UPI000B44269C|nr:YppG family protein [Halalkalibacter urbisdiaboli]